MARFTLPRDLYHGKGALEALKSFTGKKAMICVGGGSMKRFGFLDRAVAYLKEAGISNSSDSKYCHTGILQFIHRFFSKKKLSSRKLIQHNLSTLSCPITSKGHGTAGAIKRWNFSRLRMTHGTGPNHRHAGSLGACSSPSRVFKGKKMAGHYGHETVTVQNLKIAKVDAENNLIAIKGAIPGPKGGIVVIADAVKA